MRTRRVDAAVLARIALLALAVAVVTVGAGCVDRMHPRQYPRWVVGVNDPAEIQWRRCLGMRSVVKRSGKAGLGAVLEVRSRHDCPGTVTRAELVFDDGARAAATPPALPAMRGRSLHYLWLPVPFDGDAVWNAGVRRGRLELEVRFPDGTEVFTWPVFHQFEGPWR